MRRVALIGILALCMCMILWILLRGSDQLAHEPSQGAVTTPVTAEQVELVPPPTQAASPEPVESNRAVATAVAASEQETQPSTDTSTVAAFSGELILPKAWKVEKPEILARSIGWTDGITEDESANDAHREIELKASSSEFDVFRWSIGNLVPERYEICCAWPPYSIEATLTKDGTSRVVLEVPPPSQLLIAVLDSETKVPVKVEANFIAWAPKRKDGSVLPLWNGGAVRDRNTQKYTMHCVPGDGVLRCSGIGTDYGYAWLQANIRPGDNELTLLLSKTTKARVTIGDESGSIALDSGMPAFEAVGGTGQAIGFERKDSTSLLVTVSEPGQYRVTFPRPPVGYAVPKEQIVDLKPGTMTDVAIRLTRKP